FRHSTTISSRKSSTSSGSKPSLKRTCWNCLVTTSSGVSDMVSPSFDGGNHLSSSERDRDDLKDRHGDEAQDHRDGEAEIDRDRTDAQRRDVAPKKADRRIGDRVDD